MANRQTPNQLVKTFQHLCHEHLRPHERERLARSLKRFERSRDVVELAETMVALLDTPEKSVALYPIVYELIPVSCRRSYQDVLQRHLYREEDIQLQKKIHENISGLQPRDNSAINGQVGTSNTINLQKVIHLDRSRKGGNNLGFRLSYSRTCGPGYFVKSLEPEFEEWSDLEVGDELVAVNNIPVHDWQMTADQLINVVAMQRQQRAGVDIHFQRLMFSPEKLTTSDSYFVQDVFWFDIASQSFSRKHKPKWPSHLRHTQMKMQDSTNGRMGLNIRGGREFSCGIYISKLESGGLAERCGLRLGDQILTINGVSMINIPYREACRLMSYDDSLDFVVRYTGQFPIYTNVSSLQMTDLKSRDSGFLNDACLFIPVGNNYPYSNGRVDPIGSSSPRTTHSYKKSSPTIEDPLQKRLFTDTTSYIQQNPLCHSDDSSLIMSLPSSPSPVQTSQKFSVRKDKAESSHSNSSKIDSPDIPPKPPPRTGKPDMERLNEILKKRNQLAEKHRSASVNSQDGSSSNSSNVEMETTRAIVHHSPNDIAELESLESEEVFEPVFYEKVKDEPPPRSKKKSRYDEKSKPEAKTEKKFESNRKLIYENNEISDSETEIVQSELIEKVHSSQSLESVRGTLHSKTEVLGAEKPTIIVEPECSNNPEYFTDFSEVYKSRKHQNVGEVGTELLSVHCDNDDDDSHSYISSVSMEYDGDRFIIKPSEDDLTCSNCNDRTELTDCDRIDSLNSNTSTSCQNDEPREKAACSTDKTKGRPGSPIRFEVIEPVHHKTQTEERISFIPGKIAEKSKAEHPPFRKVPDSMTPSPSPPPPATSATTTMLSPQNTDTGLNSTKPKPRGQNLFRNAVIRTMNALAAVGDQYADNNSYQKLRKMASAILTKEENRKVMHDVTEYLENKDIERLVSRLLDVLNNPEKHLLLNQIRELVSPFDRGRFDSMISFYENIDSKREPNHKEGFSDKGNKEKHHEHKEDQALLTKVQCRRKQLDAQMELLENLRKTKPKVYKHREDDMNLITVYVAKNIRTLGISITGGADCKKQRAIIIEEVHFGGAAAETKRIKPGMTLISVDDENIEASSHKAAVHIIRKSFTDRGKPYTKFILRKAIGTERSPTS